jgi:peptide chain release factor
MTAQMLITAGPGPPECHLVVARLCDLLIAEAKTAGIIAVPDPPTFDRRKGTPSIQLALRGRNPAHWAGSVVGPVQWIAPSPWRPRHPRRSWFVQIGLLDADERPGAVPGFDERDVVFTPVRRGGPGGQRRNKVATAVRAEHTPSGRIVVASSQRSLSANRAAALARLADLAVREQRNHDRRRAEQLWERQHRVTRGQAVRVIRAPLT